MDNSGNSYQTNPKVQSFLESLRSRSLAPAPTSKENSPSYESFAEKLRLEQRRRQEFSQNRHREWSEIYSLKKKRESERISQIHGELQKVAKSMENLTHELDIATNKTPIEPNEYQLSVLEHIKLSLQDLRSRADNASTWLRHFNNRRQKQDYYWAMAKSQGTKFSLSEERQISMSVG